MTSYSFIRKNNIIIIISILLVISLLTNVFYYNKTKNIYKNNSTEFYSISDDLSERILDISIGNNTMKLNSSLLTYDSELSEAYIDKDTSINIKISNPFPDPTIVSLNDKELEYSKNDNTYHTKIRLDSLGKEKPLILKIKHKKQEREYKFKTIPDDFPSVNSIGDNNIDKKMFYYTNIDKTFLNDQEKDNKHSKNYIVKYDNNARVVFYKADNHRISNFNRWEDKKGNEGYYYFQEDKNSTSVNEKSYLKGKYIILDDNYNKVDEVVPQVTNKYAEPVPRAESHDFIVLGKNHYLMMDYVSALNSSTNTAGEATYLQEQKNGEVVWEWLSSDHELFNSLEPYPGNAIKTGYSTDNLHTNSISIDPNDNNIILSNRNVSTIVKIDKTTGEPIWCLGGTHNQFDMNGLDDFNYQHDATMNTNGELLLYDNGNGRPSRGLILKMDEKNKKIVSYKEIKDDVQSGIYTGSIQELLDKYYLIGWGTQRSENTLMTVFDKENSSIKSFVTNDNTINTYRFYAHEK